MNKLSPQMQHSLAAALESAWITTSGILAAYGLVFLGVYLSGTWHSIGDAVSYIRLTFPQWLVATIIIPSIRGYLAHSKFPVIDTADKPPIAGPGVAP